MKKIKFLLIAITILFISYTIPSQILDPEKNFTIGQLQEDFVTLRRLIEENHPALYRYYDKAFFSNYIDSIYRLINREMTELEFIKIIEPMIAKIRCGHTELWYSQKFEDYVYTNNFFIPISIYYIHDKAYVKRHYIKSNLLLEGSEIITINDEPVSNILKTLYSSMNGDGYNKQNILFTINKTPVSILSKYFNYTKNYKIKLIKPGESTPSTHIFEGIKYEDLIAIANKRYFKDSEDADFNYEMIDSLNTAVIKIRSFVKNKNDNFFEFLKSSFRQIDSRNIQNLIIDVRGNDGGDPDYAIELLKYVMNKDFIYFKTKVNSPEWNDPIKPYNDRYKGNIYILINGGELSTTGHFISLLKYHKIGKFIGKESGSNFTCNDNSLEFTLPNTRIRGKVARTTFETAVKGINRDRGIIPDYYIEPNIEDIIKNKDTIMEYALRLISEKN